MRIVIIEDNQPGLVMVQMVADQRTIGRGGATKQRIRHGLISISGQLSEQSERADRSVVEFPRIDTGVYGSR